MESSEEQQGWGRQSEGQRGKVKPPKRGASDQLSNTWTAFYLKKRIRLPLHQPQ